MTSVSVIHPSTSTSLMSRGVAHRTIDTEVMYDPAFGVWSSPNVGGLRHPIPPYDMELPANIRFSELRQPRWLSNAYPYIAFWPKEVSFNGPIFGRLGFNDTTLPIVATSHVSYSLPQQMIISWQRLEHALVGLVTFLVGLSPNLSRMAELGFLPLPSDCGYSRSHAEPRFVRRCAYKSREAFIILTTFCSFAIANNIEEADRMRSPPMWVLECQIAKRVHPQWLQDLQDSFVCNFSPGFRVGAYVNGYLSTWAKAFPAFKVANVPLWIWWGEVPYTVRDQVVMEKYKPRLAEVNQAKLMSKVPFPQRRDSSQNFVVGNYQAVDDCNDYPSMDVDEGQQSSGVNSLSSTTLPPDPASAPEPIRGSFQQRGEDLGSFIDRMEVILAGSKLSEEDDDAAMRLRMEKEAEDQRLDDTLSEGVAPIFEWVDAGFGHKLRVLVPEEERQSRWSLTTPDTRWYHGLVDSWSILVHSSPPQDFDPSSTRFVEAGDKDNIGQRPPNLVPEAVPQHLDGQASSVIQPRSLDSVANVDVYAEDVQKSYGRLVPASSVLSRSVGEILLCRYGFKPRVPYATDDRMKKREEVDRECRVAVSAMERLGLKACLKDDLREAVVDLYNFLIGHPTKPFAFAPLWDLHPGLWSLVTQNPKFYYCKINDDAHLLGVASKPLQSQFYLLLIPHACTVLQIFREDPQGILAIARSLISWGIPFHTVRCQTSKPKGLGWMEKESVGLGYRGPNHKFDDAEYAIYDKKKRDILGSRYGRVAVMSGGILWRLSKDVVDPKCITRGPTPSCMQNGASVASLSQFHLVDDQLSATEEDVICGVYHISGMIHCLLLINCLTFLQSKGIRSRRHRGGPNIARG